MGVNVRSGGAAPADRRLLDVLDPPVYSTNLVSYAAWIRRGSYTTGGAGGAGPPPVLESVSGWAVTAGSAAFQGGPWAEATSAAATRKTRSTSRFLMPIGFNLAAAPIFSRIPLRFQLEAVLWRATPLAAAAPLSFTVAWTGGVPSELSDTASPGYELVSRSDLNGGRWTVRVRLVNAGALTVVQDTGIDPAATPQLHAALRFDLTIAPRLSFIIDGQEYGALQGQANMPTPTASLQAPGLCQGLSVGGGVGQIDRSRQCRFYVEEL